MSKYLNAESEFKLLTYVKSNFYRIIAAVFSFLILALIRFGYFNLFYDNCVALVSEYPKLSFSIWVIILSFLCVAITTLIIKNVKSQSDINMLGLGDIVSFDHLSEDKDKRTERNKLFTKYKRDFINSSKLDLLLATGFNTIARSQNDGGFAAPLKDIFDELTSKTQVRILLIDPKCQFAHEREKSLPDYNSGRYQEDFNKTIKYLSHIKQERGLNVICHVYNRPLVWKLIIIDNVVFQQFYPIGKHIEDAPIMVFHKLIASPTEAALAIPFERLMDLLATSSDVQQVKL